eukprot:1160490-Pelagomonas_calceolata.AAC.12
MSGYQGQSSWSHIALCAKQPQCRVNIPKVRRRSPHSFAHPCRTLSVGPLSCPAKCCWAGLTRCWCPERPVRAVLCC